jgi:hypothetical protein
MCLDMFEMYDVSNNGLLHIIISCTSDYKLIHAVLSYAVQGNGKENQ